MSDYKENKTENRTRCNSEHRSGGGKRINSGESLLLGRPDSAENGLTCRKLGKLSFEKNIACAESDDKLADNLDNLGYRRWHHILHTFVVTSVG